MTGVTTRIRPSLWSHQGGGLNTHAASLPKSRLDQAGRQKAELREQSDAVRRETPAECHHDTITGRVCYTMQYDRHML